MPRPPAKSLPSLSVRIDLDPEGRIGPGKYRSLRFDFGRRPCDGHVVQAGMGSGRRDQRICRHPAVERQTGGKNGGGASLTPFGLSLVARYRKIERAAASAVREELMALRSDIGRPKKVMSR
jgi:molybdate transport system regulatory protein